MHRNVRLLRGFTFFSSLQFYRSIPILYFAHITGSYVLAAAVLSVVMLTAALAEVPTGILSDKRGRRDTLLLGTFCAVGSVTLYAAAISYPLLLVGAVLQGLSEAFYSGNNDALLYESLAADKTTDSYAHVYSRINALHGIGALTSSIIGSMIASYSFTVAAWLSLPPLLVNLVLGWQMVEPRAEIHSTERIHLHLRTAFREMRKNPRLRWLSLAAIFDNGFGLTAYQFQAAAYALVWPLWAIGWARAFGELLAAIGFRFSDRIIGRLGEGQVMLWGTVYGWLANIVGALAQSSLTPMIISSSVLLYGADTTASESLKQREFTDSQRATMASLNALGSSLLYGIFSILMGLFADRLNPFAALLVTQAFYTGTIFCVWRVTRLLR
ncbi:MAG: MFS transporter [Anaerolineae bacterium]|nr:MFS transporter [Anaerolineae bacterium]